MWPPEWLASGAIDRTRILCSPFTPGSGIPANAPDEIGREREIYERAGVQHVIIALRSPDVDSRLKAVEQLALLFNLEPR
jgi:hypothetical protein